MIIKIEECRLIEKVKRAKTQSKNKNRMLNFASKLPA
jgi:hypothetical protein